MASRPPLRFSLRGLFAWGLLSILGMVLVRPVTWAFVPLMQGVVDVLQSDYVAQLSVVESKQGPEVVMSCTVIHDIAYSDGRVVHYLGPVRCAYMDAVHALVPPVVFLLPVMVWPLQRRREASGRILACIFLLPLVVALTAPVLLVGLARWTLYPASANAPSALAALLQPIAFVELGGGWLTALIASMLCLRAGRTLAEHF